VVLRRRDPQRRADLASWLFRANSQSGAVRGNEGGPFGGVMNSSIDWLGLAVIGVLVLALVSGLRLAPTGPTKTVLRVVPVVALALFAAILVWNVSVTLLGGPRHEG
jgi:hypothetical protein